MTNHIAMDSKDTRISTVPPLAGGKELEFHRLAKASSTYRWWRPPLVGVIAAALYAVMFTALMVTIAVAGLALPDLAESMEAFSSDSNFFDMSDPHIFALMMIPLILMIPALFIATRILGAKPVGLLSSVAGRLRLRWLGQCLLAATFVFAFGFSVEVLLMVSEGESRVPTPHMAQTTVLLAMVIVLMPLQSAAEEYVFRGYLVQAIGSWLRHPAFAILLPVPLFVLGHGYGPVGMTGVAIFAVVAGWLTWRTGGLEAAIAMHVINNVGVGILSAVGLMDINATEQSVPSLILSLIIMGSFAVVVVRLSERAGIRRTAHQPVASAELCVAAGHDKADWHI